MTLWIWSCFSVMRYGGKISVITSFFPFLPFLYLQSVPSCTKAGGLVMMRGIIHTNLINILFPSYCFCLLAQSAVHQAFLPTQDEPLWGFHLLLLYAMLELVHLKERNAFLWADFFFLLENGRERLLLTKATPSTFCHVWTWFCCCTWQRYLGQAETGSTNVIHLKFPPRVTAMCFYYSVVYKKEKG